MSDNPTVESDSSDSSDNQGSRHRSSAVSRVRTDVKPTDTVRTTSTLSLAMRIAELDAKTQPFLERTFGKGMPPSSNFGRNDATVTVKCPVGRL